MKDRGEEPDDLGAGVFGGGVGKVIATNIGDHAGDEDGQGIANKRAVI